VTVRDFDDLAGAYLEHLTEADLALLFGRSASAGSGAPGAHGGRWRPPAASAAQIEGRLSDPGVFDAVFGQSASTQELWGVSPFLAFALAVQRARTELETAPYVSEWLGLRQRAPVFDVAHLREFMADPWRRLFLAQLLASYTHVASGSVWVPTRRGVRRQRFSELDPVRLAGLLDVVSDIERPGILRRLGDVALFLTGVFPDYVARRGFGPVEEGRLLRAGGVRRGATESAGSLGLGDPGAVGLLDQLGRRWYQGAFTLAPRPLPSALRVLGELPQRFGQARRILNFVTERFLFAHRGQWFGFGPG
jgi:hypothetical protein